MKTLFDIVALVSERLRFASATVSVLGYKHVHFHTPDITEMQLQQDLLAPA